MGDQASGATENFSLSAITAPFKGGVLVPNPDVLLGALPVDGNGDIELSASWPPGVPPGLPLWMQAWVSDPSGPVGFTASNGIMGTTSP